MLESDPDIVIVGTAKNGEEGFELAKTLKPDLITLDIEMPVMNGLDALQKIMKYCPTSVLMISSLTSEGAQATLKALELGAVDFIPKELSFVNVNIIKIKEDLIKKIKEIVRRRLYRRSFPTSVTSVPTKSGISRKLLPVNKYMAVAIGISTGGPMSLQKIIPCISPNINCPIFIVQHMPPHFTKSLADRLDAMSKITVKEAENGELIKNNTAYLAPGGFHMTVRKGSHGNEICTSLFPDNTLHRPSVDIMIKSVSEIYSKNAIGVIMTGMGKDGTEGIRELKNIGGVCLAQDEDSCIVYGMPKSVVDSGMTDVVASLEEIPIIINKAFGQ